MQRERRNFRRTGKSPIALRFFIAPLAAFAVILAFAGPLSAQRERPALDITGYVIDAELDTAAHHITAKTVVTFTAPPNLEVVNFGFHPALKITKITDAAGKLLDGERTADGSVRPQNHQDHRRSRQAA